MINFMIKTTTFFTYTHSTKLPIEHGRWNNIPRENRKYNLCNLEEIDDEFHYILNNIEIFISRRDIQHYQILLTSWGLWCQQID